jgi:hypothetical protein
LGSIGFGAGRERRNPGLNKALLWKAKVMRTKPVLLKQNSDNAYDASFAKSKTLRRE